MPDFMLTASLLTPGRTSVWKDGVHEFEVETDQGGEVQTVFLRRGGSAPTPKGWTYTLRPIWVPGMAITETVREVLKAMR
jgi:hypothetical protein